MKQRNFGFLAVAAMALLACSSVFATPTVEFILNGTTYTCASAGVSCSGAGTDASPIIASLSETGVSASVDIAYSEGPTTTYMDEDDSTTSMTAGNTLKILFSDTGFTAISGLAETFGGTLQGGGGASVSATGYYSTGNSLFAESTQIGSVIGPFTATPFSGSTTGTPPGSEPYSLTQVITFTTGTKSASFSGDFNLSGVPEPASVVLLGSLLVVAGLFGRKLSRNAA